jgi:long-chain acyl-CoA synthetase
MLSHNNIVSDVLNSAPRIPFEAGKVLLSFLPVCHHIFERMILYLHNTMVFRFILENLLRKSDNIKK